MSQALEEGIEWVEEYIGISEKMTAIMQDNLKGQLTILKSQLEELAISFGELLMPAIRAVVSKVQAFVDKLNSMSEAQKKTMHYDFNRIPQDGAFAENAQGDRNHERFK